MLELLTIAKQAAWEAGEYLKQRFMQQLTPDLESHNDVKLPEDKESERRIIAWLERHVPDHSIFSEEVGFLERGEEFVWIVDPLDGTNNFYIGYPYFSVSLALERSGTLELGVVYNPIAEQMFWAERGKGAYLNDKRLTVNNRRDLRKAVGTYIRGREGILREEELAFTQPFDLHTKRLLRTIAPALDWCLLASGWIDYIIMQRSGVMDVAAGMLIAQEAGATITDWQGQVYHHRPFAPDYFPSLVASNGPLHEAVRRLIQE